MARLKVADLDALAERQDVGDYPFGGSKSEKEAFLEERGFDLSEVEPMKSWKLRLKDGVEKAAFQAGAVNVELDSEHPEWETSEERLYLGARDLPFLEEVE